MHWFACFTVQAGTPYFIFFLHEFKYLHAHISQDLFYYPWMQWTISYKILKKWGLKIDLCPFLHKSMLGKGPLTLPFNRRFQIECLSPEGLFCNSFSLSNHQPIDDRRSHVRFWQYREGCDDSETTTNFLEPLELEKGKVNILKGSAIFETTKK